MIERFPGKAAWLAAFPLFFLLGAVTPVAASISVSPVRLDLDASRDKEVIRVSNQEDGQKSYQVEVVAWSQEDGQPEVYAPTEALLVVPPLFTLEPGEDQLVRVGMLEPADEAVEKTYRVFITEIAPPQPEAPEVSGVNMRLQIGVPVFVAPTAPVVPTLDLVDTRNIDGKLFLELRNAGNVHVKVSRVTYAPPGLEDPVVSPAAMYVLAGQTGSLPVPSPGGRAVGKVTIVTDTLGTLEYELPGTP
jgi:fimbrial chaperone protein